MAWKHGEPRHQHSKYRPSFPGLFRFQHRNSEGVCYLGKLLGRRGSCDIAKINTLRPGQNICISIRMALKFVPMGPINNVRGLVQMMAWRLQGNRPLSEPMIVSLLTHICVTRLQWFKDISLNAHYYYAGIYGYAPYFSMIIKFYESSWRCKSFTCVCLQ